MFREDVLNSAALIKRFCKNNNLPIQVFEEPHFSNRLFALDYVFDCVNKFDDFCNDLLFFENEQSYFEHYNTVKEMAISFIKDQPEYREFVEDQFVTQTQYSAKNLYVDENDDCTFISIDMKKANYSSMNHYSPAIFGFSDTWEEFMKRFTDCDHIIKSKYVRQVILGACNPKKQIQYETYLMSKLVDHIAKNIPSVSVYSLASDEIILRLTEGCGFSKRDLQKVISKCHDGIGSLVRVEIFELHKANHITGWIKNIYDEEGTVQFKCIDPDIMSQAIKYYYGMPIVDEDLIVLHNGKLAKFLSPIDDPWAHLK